MLVRVLFWAKTGGLGDDDEVALRIDLKHGTSCAEARRGKKEEAE